MRFNQTLLTMIFVLILFSCQKGDEPYPTQPPTVHGMPILLKDIIIPHLPSPYYHFEYNSDSLVSKADFSSGFGIYHITYKDNKIGEMQNDILFNHDILRYFYDSGNKVSRIDFINDNSVTYRHAYFDYQGDQVKEIWWTHKDANGDYPVDRILTFTSYPDGNVKSIKEQRYSGVGDSWQTTIKTFEQYDEGINVDDFSLIHDGIHDHLFLLQGFRLQKNNPGKETLSLDGIDLYTVDYTYTYNSDHTPATKNGNLLYKSGPDAGKIFEVNTTYTYY